MKPIAARAVAAPPQLVNTDFDLVPEPGRPYIHYLENAERLAQNLLWFADGVDTAVASALDAEITAFAATYAPRPGDLVGAGPMPGLVELKTAYDALAYHVPSDSRTHELLLACTQLY